MARWRTSCGRRHGCSGRVCPRATTRYSRRSRPCVRRRSVPPFGKLLLRSTPLTSCRSFNSSTSSTAWRRSALMNDAKLRRSAEELFAEELAALKRGDDRPRPENWLLSPQAVVTYVLGGTAKDGTAISAKYVGNRRLIETAVATLATDRALLLLGLPGTAKAWVSDHLAAAVSGSSQRLIQCTAGTDENQIRYGWNYAMLLAGGPSMAALVKTPLTRAMEEGTILRLEELTRMGSDTQDTLITGLSEKTLPLPQFETNN